MAWGALLKLLTLISIFLPGPLGSPIPLETTKGCGPWTPGVGRGTENEVRGTGHEVRRVPSLVILSEVEGSPLLSCMKLRITLVPSVVPSQTGLELISRSLIDRAARRSFDYAQDDVMWRLTYCILRLSFLRILVLRSFLGVQGPQPLVV